MLETEEDQAAVEDALCVPADRAIESRWCSVTHFAGGGTSTGWVKRSFLRRFVCP